MNKPMTFRKFAKLHGGEENAVHVEGENRIIFPDGCEAFGEGVGAMLLDYDETGNRYLSSDQKLHMRRKKAANVILHRQALHQHAVNVFDELKERLRGTLDPTGKKRLLALKAEVEQARKEVRKAERAAERIEPGYISPAERRRFDEIEANEQDEIDSFNADLDAIRL